MPKVLLRATAHYQHLSTPQNMNNDEQTQSTAWQNAQM